MVGAAIRWNQKKMESGAEMAKVSGRETRASDRIGNSFRTGTRRRDSRLAERSRLARSARGAASAASTGEANVSAPPPASPQGREAESGRVRATQRKELTIKKGIRIFALAAALGLGLLAAACKPRATPPAAETPRRSPQEEAAFAEARRTVIKNLHSPSTAQFSSYSTDDNTGAAEIGHGIWEAWGKVDYRDATGAGIHTDWHVAWDRRTTRIIYWKIGSRETGNYAEALGASRAYPPGPDSAD